MSKSLAWAENRAGGRLIDILENLMGGRIAGYERLRGHLQLIDTILDLITKTYVST